MLQNFSVKSSSGHGFYSVKIIKQSGKIKIVCDCPAGAYNQICKHKIKILKGDTDILASKLQAPQLISASKMLEKTQYYLLLAEINKAEQVVTTAQKNLKNIKKKVGRLMSEGMPI